MSDPLYTKYIVVPTNQCNYYIYEVCARHAISTTGLYHIDRANNIKLPFMPSAYKAFLPADKVFDSRCDAENYAQNILMPKELDEKLRHLKWLIGYYEKLVNKFLTTKPKARFAKLTKAIP